MSNTIIVTGTVGHAPVTEKTDKGKTHIIRFPLLCDEWIRVIDEDATLLAQPVDGQKRFKIIPDTNKQAWYQVRITKTNLGEAVTKTIKKGARITVEGHLHPTIKIDPHSNKPTLLLTITADNVLHNLNKVEEIRLRPERLEM